MSNSCEAVTFFARNSDWRFSVALVECQIGFRSGQSCFVGPWINAEKQIAFLYVGAVLNSRRDNLPGTWAWI